MTRVPSHIPLAIAKAASYREVLHRLHFPGEQVKIAFGRNVGNASTPAGLGEQFVEVQLVQLGQVVYSILCGRVPDEQANLATFDDWNVLSFGERDAIYQELISEEKFRGLTESLLNRGIVPPVFTSGVLDQLEASLKDPEPDPEPN